MRLIHWVSALVVLGLLSVGFLMTDLEVSPQKLAIYGLHKSIGMSVLGLVILRIIWRGFNKPLEHLSTHAPWERALAKFIHVLLYVGLIGMPLSGWVMSSAGDFPNSYFGLFEFPDFVSKDKALFALSKSIHELCAFALIAAVGLHFLGAVKHHIMDRDETLTRMGGNLFILGFAAVLLGSASLLAGQELLLKFGKEQASAEQVLQVQAITPVQAGAWVVDQGRSKITFEATQYGQNFQGAFPNFISRIVFDPNNLSLAEAEIEIDITSIKTGADDRDQQARGSDWFDIANFPNARFVSRSFEALSANQYKVSGDFTLRGITKSLDFPFSLIIDDQNSAHMRAEFSLSRLAYGIGQGAWKSTDTIGDNVVVRIDLYADRASSF